MADGRETVREIVWQDICPWLILLRTFRLAITLRVLLLSAVALMGVSAGWRVIGAAFSGADDPELAKWVVAQKAWPWDEGYGDQSLKQISSSVPVELVQAVPVVGNWLLRGPILRVGAYLSAPFFLLFQRDITIAGLAFALLSCFWVMVVCALLAGAITRITALALTREEHLGMKAAVDYARSKWGAYFSAPLFPLVGVLLVSLPLVIGGLLMRIELGLLLAGLLWPLVILAGLFVAILVVGLVFGWPLMWATISTEGTDAFDALSRSYAYVYQRPLHYLLYTLVVSVIGLLGSLIVVMFADGVLFLGDSAVLWGIGDNVRTKELGTIGQWGESLIGFWKSLVTTLKHGFQFGFFWVSAVGVYLLLRRNVDATEMDEIYLGDEEPAQPLPPLERETQEEEDGEE